MAGGFGVSDTTRNVGVCVNPVTVAGVPVADAVGSSVGVRLGVRERDVTVAVARFAVGVWVCVSVGMGDGVAVTTSVAVRDRKSVV